MTPRKFALSITPLALLVTLVVAACGGGGDGDTDTRVGTGQLTDPRNVATATPWPDTPEPIILDPDALTPLSGGIGVGGVDPVDGDGDGDGDDPDGEPGECGDTYTIEAGDTLFGVAEKCNVDPDDVLAANPDVDPSTLSIGQVINLP